MKNTFAYLTKQQYNGIDRFQENAYGVDNKTICFIADTNEIYTHGKSFGKVGNGDIGNVTIDGQEIKVIVDSETNKVVIDPENLPIASTGKFGIVKIDPNGGIAVSGGVIGISAAAVYNKLKQYLKDPNTPNNDDEDPFKLKPATTDTLGGVYVPGGDGLVINTSNNKGKLTFDPTKVNMQSLWTTLRSYLTSNNIQIGGGKSKLSELDDVNTQNIQTGYVLKWDATNNRWNAAEDNSSGGDITGGYVKSFTQPDQNGNVTFTNSAGLSISINTQGGNGITPNGLQFYQDELKLSLSNSSEISAETPVANSEYRGMVRAVSVNEDSDYLNNDYANINENDELVIPLFIGSDEGDAYIKIASYDIAALNEANEDTPIINRATKRAFGVVKLGLDQDDNIDVDNIDLSNDDNRKYPLSMDANGCAFVTVPWRVGVNEDYVNSKVAEAIEAAERVGETLDQYSDALNSLTEGTFADDLAAATSAILAAQGDLDTLHGWIAAGHSEGPVFGDDSTYLKVYDYLNPQSGSYASFTEAINTNLQDAITNNNGVLRSEVLNIVNANVPNTDGIVTTVKNQIISDGTFATQSFVTSTVQTGVDTGVGGLKDQYTSGGLYIDSSGKVVLRTNDVQIDKGTSANPSKQSFANGIYDATKGLIEQATATQIGDAVNEVGLSLNSSTGEFALITQSGNSTLTTDGPKINITDVAGVIGSTANAASSVWAGIMANATVNGKKASASVIADVNKSTGDSSIYLNADRVVVGGTKNADGTISGGEFVANKITAIEADIDTINANLINADTILSTVNGTEYLYVEYILGQSGNAATLRPWGLYFGASTDVDDMKELTLANNTTDYANVGSIGALFYPIVGQTSTHGIKITANESPVSSSIWMVDADGEMYYDADGFSFITKTNTDIKSSLSSGKGSITSYPHVTLRRGDNGDFRLYMGADTVGNKSTTISRAKITLRDNNGTNSCEITAEGPTTSSDIRYKNIVDDINLSIADIAAAPKFTYTASGDTSGKVTFGTSAQYWRSLIPQSVVENEDGKLAMYYDKTALVAAISVAEEVVALKNEIAELKLQIAALTSNN